MESEGLLTLKLCGEKSLQHVAIEMAELYLNYINLFVFVLSDSGGVV